MRIKLQHARGAENEGGGTYYFEIQADGNFETLATSEIYNDKAAALHAISLILEGRDNDSYVDATTDR